jgi:hypothetical protein
LQKLLAVQTKLREIAELRLKRLRDEEARLKQEQTETITALNDGGPLHGLFVEPMARRLQDLSGQLTSATGAIARELAATITETAKAKHLERLTADAELAHSRRQERKELLNNASLP